MLAVRPRRSKRGRGIGAPENSPTTAGRNEAAWCWTINVRKADVISGAPEPARRSCRGAVAAGGTGRRTGSSTSAGRVSRPPARPTGEEHVQDAIREQPERTDTGGSSPSCTAISTRGASKAVRQHRQRSSTAPTRASRTPFSVRRFRTQRRSQPTRPQAEEQGQSERSTLSALHRTAACRPSGAGRASSVSRKKSSSSDLVPALPRRSAGAARPGCRGRAPGRGAGSARRCRGLRPARAGAS